MSVQTRLTTADELLTMPDDGRHRYELVQGELVTMSPAGSAHGAISARILSRLDHYVDERKLGRTFSSDTGFLLARDPDTVRCPDASFVSATRYRKTEGYVHGAPDLAVEVISPTDLYTEVEEKVGEYLRAGTRMVIVVDPRKQTATVNTPSDVRRLTIEDSIEGADVVPGWLLPLRDVFAD